MERRVEGTFQSKTEAKKEIERLIHEEGYRPKELLLVTEENGEFQEDTSIDEVAVDVVDAEDEGSFWERIKETLSFGTYHSSEAENALEKHGVTHELADHYLDALQEGEIVLLANSDAPTQGELSEVNGEIIDEEENDIMVDKKKDAPVDEVNSEEEEAIKDPSKGDKDPSDVSTSETQDEAVKGEIDPSQADSTRSDETSHDEADLEDSTTTEDDATDPSTNPDLTGEEDTVEEYETDRKEPTTAKGQVKPDIKSPLNAEPKEEKDPSEESEAPEGDAEYPEDQEKAGMKNEGDNE